MTRPHCARNRFRSILRNRNARVLSVSWRSCKDLLHRLQLGRMHRRFPFVVISRPCRISLASWIHGLSLFFGWLKLPGIVRMGTESLQFRYGHEAEIAAGIESPAAVSDAV